MEPISVITLVILSCALYNFVGYILLKLTANYKKTETKADDLLHKVIKASLDALKKTNDIFFSRY